MFFPVGRDSKKFEDWGRRGGLKNLELGGGGYRFGGSVFAGGVSTPLHAMSRS